MRSVVIAGLTGALAFVTGCRTEQTFLTPDPHLERMLKQEKALPYDQDLALPKGMTMQQPPEGTMPINVSLGDPLLNLGIANGHYADKIPVHVDRALVETGRQRFNVICAACHGVLGDGASAVANKMALRKPPTLLVAPVRDYPPGHIFEAVQRGYGLMPSYRVELSVQETWAVVAYVRALQLARFARASDLTPQLRAQLSAL